MQGSLLVHDLRKVITLVDLLRDIGLGNQLSLPKVVVLGNQSSGKSSLLEQIVGLDFLPRGSGVVTRRPLELRMNNIQGLKAPYAQFDEIIEGGKKKKFTDFNKVRESINEVTDKVCGSQKIIVDKPIILNIFSNSCPNLTIVDLPGITSIPVGKQPSNIYEITKNMAYRYIKEKRSIILCVIPANQDLSTSQALKLLQEIDPSGQRSIGCLTKIDIMDRGVDARAVLRNQQIPLRYGYIGIKNRSQQDINNNVPVSESLKKQKLFFTKSPIYSTLPPQNFGTESLTHKLTAILYTQIKSSMPEIFKQIKAKKNQAQLQLDKLGPGVASTDAQMVNFAWKSISSFLRIFKNSIEGIKSPDYPEDPVSASIRDELYNLYKQQYQQPATADLEDRDIQKAMINFPGDSTIPGFPSIDAFLALMNPLLKKLQNPAYTINNRVHEIMQIQSSQIIDTILTKKFPDFNHRFSDLVKRVLEKFRKELESYLAFLLDSELNYLYTNDRLYLAGQFGLTDEDKKKMQNGKVRDPLIFQLRKRIDSYYKLVVRNLRDMVPKQVFNFLIVKCLRELQFQSFQFTSDIAKLKDMLNEPSQIRTKREQYQKAIKVFEQSEKKIRMDPEISKLVRDTQKQSKYYSKFGLKSPEQIQQEEDKKRIQQAKKKRANHPKPTHGQGHSGSGHQGSGHPGHSGGTHNTTQNGHIKKNPDHIQSPSSTKTDNSNRNTDVQQGKSKSNNFSNLFGKPIQQPQQSPKQINTNQVSGNSKPQTQPQPTMNKQQNPGTGITNPSADFGFFDKPSQPNPKQPTMTKQQNPGTGTATTGKNDLFFNNFEAPKKQQPPNPPPKPQPKKQQDKKRTMTFNNLFGVK